MSKYLEAVKVALEKRDFHRSLQKRLTRRVERERNYLEAAKWHRIVIALYMVEAMEGWTVVERVVGYMKPEERAWVDQWR